MTQEADLFCKHCPSFTKTIFSGLPDSELQDFCKVKVFKTYKKGEVLFSQGSPNIGIFCINKGDIKIIRKVGEDKESIVKIASDNDILGHRSLFTADQYQTSAIALGPVNICFIKRDYILNLLRDRPIVATKLIKKMGEDLAVTEKRLSSFQQHNARKRLAELLLLLKEKHGKETESGFFLDIKLTREEMASIIGTASETLIRFLSEFKQEGLVEMIGKKLYIVSEENLCKLTTSKN